MTSRKPGVTFMSSRSADVSSPPSQNSSPHSAPLVDALLAMPTF